MASAPPADAETRKAADAFAVWCVLRRAEADSPELRDNPFYMAVRADVYADMMMEFDRL